MTKYTPLTMLISAGLAVLVAHLANSYIPGAIPKESIWGAAGVFMEAACAKLCQRKTPPTLEGR